VSSNKTPWYESDSPSRHAWGMGRIVAVFIAVIVVLGLGTWGFRVATSGVKGAGDQAVKVNAADNRIFAQQYFPQLYNQILAYDQQLDQAAENKNAHPNESTFITQFTGLTNICIGARADYNAAAVKVTQAKWRDPGLPFSIDPADPRTDCKPTATTAAPSPIPTN